MNFLLKHEKECRFPRAKCTCKESRYRRLWDPRSPKEAAGPSQANVEEEHETSLIEAPEEIIFYGEHGVDGQSILVEKNLVTSDLCELLAVKTRKYKSNNWSLVEFWPDLGIERTVEDHEYVLSAYKDVQYFSKKINFKFIFREDVKKYEIFDDPLLCPSDMIGLDRIDRITNPNFIHSAFLVDEKLPCIISAIFALNESKTWVRAYLILWDRKLYLTNKANTACNFVKHIRYIRPSEVTTDNFPELFLIADLKYAQIYNAINARNQFKGPFQWGIVLNPLASTETADLDEGQGRRRIPFLGNTPPKNVKTASDLRCFICDSDRVRTCWITAMRLAKYGKQLRENYRAFKNKQQQESINPKEYNSYTVPNPFQESVRSRVAMDFTGSVGRIVEDPKEAKAIAVAEGYSWKRRWKPHLRLSSQGGIAHGLDSGIHITQPWFHSGMSRDHATALITRHGTCDGVFLVRESRSNQGAFVLTYKCNSKVFHAQITPVRDQVSMYNDVHVLSLDNGVTKFYDLLQLVEFYQLNAGSLPTRLTHFVVQTNSRELEELGHGSHQLDI